MRHDAFETLGRPHPGCIVYTCEHASNRVPAPLHPTPSDRALLRTHWGYDIGSAWLTRRLAHGDVAVLSRASRLVLDANRHPADPTLALSCTHDGPVSFNQSISDSALDARIQRFHVPLHDEISRVMTVARPRLLVSVHTFTPVWQGNLRDLEAGILFDTCDKEAGEIIRALRADGWKVEANEPYSGKAGLIYSAARHGNAAGVPYFEIEVRQDLVATRLLAEVAAERIRDAMRECGW